MVGNYCPAVVITCRDFLQVVHLPLPLCLSDKLFRTAAVDIPL